MKSVEVTILGQRYKIRGEADEEYMKSVARFVDEKMREIIGKNPNIAPLKAAILAGINIADELFKLRKEQRTIEERTKELERVIQNV